MSVSTMKRDGATAALTAEKFRDLFAGCFEKWEVAGSVRRQCREVGDIDHLAIPRIEMRQDEGSMFAAEKPVNLLWERADQLVKAGTIYRHVRDGGGYCWGEKYRSTIYGDTKHDIFTADVDSWGPQLAIRTGPWEFSKRMVTGLLQNGRRNIDGYVWNCRPCRLCSGQPHGTLCHACDSKGIDPVEQLSVQTEEEYFDLCGVAFRKPEVRR